MSMYKHCEICNGDKGGVAGNNQIINGKRVCDYCHADGSYKTVSVQPTTSEPNERDIPTMSQFANVNDCVLAREKWYQDRIESLQAKLDHKQRYLDAMDIKGGYAKLESENNALQAQLNVAIEALEKTLANTYDLSPKADFIREALAEINRIGE